MKRKEGLILREYKELPYTLVGSSSFPPRSFQVVLSIKGLKAITEKANTSKYRLVRMTFADEAPQFKVELLK